jgi:cobalt-zinc-cadmium resistance protein CzcA
LLEGAILVIVILFLFLGNMRAAIITAMVIPLAMLFTFTGMVTYKVSANLMSLGALDFGIIIDGAVVIVENCIRRLSHAQEHFKRELTLRERFHEVFAAAKEARRPLLFGQLIIMVEYLPIFALAGVEGKMFHPMAFAVVVALLGAMILSMTFIPAAVALFIGKRVAEKENRLMVMAKNGYEPLLAKVMNNATTVITGSVVLIILCGLLATRLGSEFVPNLNEGDISIQALRIPGTSLSQSLEMQKKLEAGLKAKFPKSIVSLHVPVPQKLHRTRCHRISRTAISCSSQTRNGLSRRKPATNWSPKSRKKPRNTSAMPMSSPAYSTAFQ